MKHYRNLFIPELIGGIFFIHNIYTRSFFVGILQSVVGVIFIKLQGTHLTTQEIAVLAQLAALSALLIPLLGGLTLKTLARLTIITEFLEFSIPLLYLLDVLNTRTFLYIYALLEVFLVLVYSNLSSVFLKYEQSKTKPETAEIRSRGKTVISAAGGIFGTIIIMLVSSISDDITYLLYIHVGVAFIGNILFYVTNKNMIRFAEDNVKYPVIREVNS